jgi:glycosyltransferase involved in cell wall biosynthesis
MTPLVSVVIPTYNRWPMVEEAVDSVLAQNYKDFEVIVIDDGSEDGTIEQLGKYGTRIRLFSESRRGVAAARNSGVRQSTGRYVAFLDSDDLWKPKKLEVQVAFMESHLGAEICQTEEVWIRNGVRVNPKKKHLKPSGDIFRASLDLCLVSPSAVMMTRKLFDRQGGFDESFPVCEDYDLWLRVAVETPVFLVPEPLVVKRGGHTDQLSRSTWGLDRFRVVALRKLLDAGIHGEKRAWVLEALARKIAILAHGAGKRGRQSEALNYNALLTGFIGES